MIIVYFNRVKIEKSVVSGIKHWNENENYEELQKG